MRQMIHYVRPGAVRVQATLSDSNVRVVSFVRNGTITTVMENNGADTIFTLNGLPPGEYGISQCPSGASTFSELGIKTVGADGTLSFNSGSAGYVSTVYPYSGTNQPPDIMSWSANPGYVVADTTTAVLSFAANHNRLGQLHYTWTVVSQPAGANAIISGNSAKISAYGISAQETVRGLTVPRNVCIQYKRL